MKCNIRPQQVTGTCLYREWTLHRWSQCHIDISVAVIEPSSHLVRSVFAVVECRAAFDIGWTVADSGPFKCLWYTVQQRWIIFHSSACFQSRCEVKGKRRQRPACSAQHAALTLEVNHPLLEGGKMAWLNTKNFSCAISWDRCENLVLELVLWPATIVILWRLFVHRFLVLVAPLNCICIAN